MVDAWKCLGLVALIAGWSGCISTGFRGQEDLGPAKIPAAMQPLFSACTPSDGTVQLSLTGGGLNLSQLEMVWNIPENPEWQIQFNTPLGDTKLAVQRQRGVFSATGEVRPELAIDDRHFLKVNGHTLPLRDSELPCVLSGRWPWSWLSFLSQQAASPGSLDLKGDDDGRFVSMTTSFIQGSRVVKSCAVIQWGGILGFFRKSSDICLQRAEGAFDVELKGPADYVVKWKQSHE